MFKVSAKNRTMKIVLSVVGAAAVLSGLYYMYRTRNAAESQTKMDKVA